MEAGFRERAAGNKGSTLVAEKKNLKARNPGWRLTAEARNPDIGIISGGI